MLRFLSRRIGEVYCACLLVSISLILFSVGINFGMTDSILNREMPAKKFREAFENTPSTRTKIVGMKSVFSQIAGLRAQDVPHMSLLPQASEATIVMGSSPQTPPQILSQSAPSDTNDVLTWQVMRDPSNKALNVKLAQAQIREGRLDSAAGTLSRILFFAPNDSVARLDLALIEMTRDRPDTAQRHLQILLTRHDLSAVLRTRAQALFRRLTHVQITPADLASQATSTKSWRAQGFAKMRFGTQGNALQASHDGAGFTTDILLYSYENQDIVSRPFVAYNSRAKIDASYIVSQIALRLSTNLQVKDTSNNTATNAVMITLDAQQNRQFANAFDNEMSAGIQFAYLAKHAEGQYQMAVRTSYQQTRNSKGFFRGDAYVHGSWAIDRHNSVSASVSYADTTPRADISRESQTSVQLSARHSFDGTHRHVLDARLIATDYRSARATHKSDELSAHLAHSWQLTPQLHGFLSVATGRRDYALAYPLNGGYFQRDNWQMIRTRLLQTIKNGHKNTPTLSYSLSYRNVSSTISLERYHAFGGTLSLTWSFGRP